MRVVFQTVPIATKAVLPDGNSAPGIVTFQAKIYDSQEEFRSVWPKATLPPTAAVWSSQANTAGNIIVPASKRHHPDAPPVTIPSAVLASVPHDAFVAMEWWWEPVR